MKILHGDCLEKMKELEDNSVDTIITDPPYGLSFMGKKWDYDVPKVEIWKEALRVLKPGGTALIFAGSRTQHRMAVNVEDAGFILKDTIMWLYGSGFPKATDISKQLDKGHERKVVGVSSKQPSGFIRHGRTDEEVFNGTDKKRIPEYITTLTTPEAKLWNGWKSHGLKPAYEPIIVAMKPNEGTYANNALKWGVSGLNIDGGRIGENAGWNYPNGRQGKGCFGKTSLEENLEEPIKSSQGRFPANILLDEEAAKMLDEQSGVSKSTPSKGHIRNGNVVGDNRTAKNAGQFGDGAWIEGNKHNDKGGASRFFYVAKASKKERNTGCERLEEKKVSDGREKEADNAYQRGKTLRQNSHPTVKPLKLMEYLCILTKTPTSGIVLDPFMGSGTTGLACQNTGRDFIGIEREEEYIKIANARLNSNNKLL